ncbi:hypothetical protein B0T25DRAFT_560600 [Lasiosphaeria hispida]|uniref:Uncharacterized protein n=1 Tax=Lasiosphaeria hispida TaxID=260671 RepID=A0AAJ0H5Q9_9PEZI|nr:hypothetical protein B0T25DRAFT_560600 [Lasiosphaeria hispida]
MAIRVTFSITFIAVVTVSTTAMVSFSEVLMACEMVVNPFLMKVFPACSKATMEAVMASKTMTAKATSVFSPCSP